MVSRYLRKARMPRVVRPKFAIPGLLILVLSAFAVPRDVYAYANYEVGHITRVSYTTYGVLPTTISGAVVRDVSRPATDW